MHQQVKQLTDAGIAVRYLAFPRTGLDSESYHKAVTVWCSADRKQALTDAKLGKELPRQECDNPVAAQYELGQAMGVHGTPAVYTEDGTEIGGYLPAADIIRMYAGN
jgi:thiol:disulfide interchange protein DsbC